MLRPAHVRAFGIPVYLDDNQPEHQITICQDIPNDGPLADALRELGEAAICKLIEDRLGEAVAARIDELQQEARDAPRR